LGNCADEDGGLVVREVGKDRDTSPSPFEIDLSDQEGDQGHAFAAENHLRDYFAQHLDLLEKGLRLYVSDDGATGVEYPTPVGRLDILALDSNDQFVVIELKVSKGPDSVCGQLMRYMGWVKRHLANGQAIRGFIIAQHISAKIRYAVVDLPNVFLKEYELSLTLRDAGGIDAVDS
jgi:RecB family endonuclease NucS